ncbi:MAG: GNAT family N-acetyltransferase [Candidatus Obscuribacterales bacterium]|nr:GNAT family N-acetyltransferase [Candidatus Obscuribacterales bacterium]
MVSPSSSIADSSSQAASGKPWLELLNVLEPPNLIDYFMVNPPLGFKSLKLTSASKPYPAFLASFDLLTTLDEEGLFLRQLVKRFSWLGGLFRYPALFIGTTATEYANYPHLQNYDDLRQSLLAEFKRCQAQLLIVKDIPQNSPLLTAQENAAADAVIECCRQAGFSIVAGQALAYVPIDFSSLDQFFGRMSKSRRKDFRKKLKESASLKIEELKSGDPIFYDESFLADFYKMYLNVYEQSEIHFDLLSPAFFKALLQDNSNNGRIFIYKSGEDLIGYNFCFVHNNMLVDKYVGFLYPQAREANLYFVSWFYNLEYALKEGLKTYIAGWTDPAVKASLGASFTLTRHAVYVRNPLLRAILQRFQHLFEADKDWVSNGSDV